MSDLINRKAAIDEINERQRKLIYCFGFENDMVKIMNIAKSIITSIPSAQPEVLACGEGELIAQPERTGRWIPCSERMPDKGGYYLWSAKGGEVKKDFYWEGHWDKAEKYGYEVIAWMPLPEPYKGGEQDE